MKPPKNLPKTRVPGDYTKPELATLVREPFSRPGWIFEIKWDGYRTMAKISKVKVELYSRNLLSFNELFAPIVQVLSKIKSELLLDGEMVVLDGKGRSSFQLLQNYQNSGQGNLVYYVFDILKLGSKDLTNLPLRERKKILKKVLPKLKNVKYSDHIVTEGKKFFKVAVRQNLEGIMAKDEQSVYKPGVRSEDWLKIKTHLRQEAVIGGFTEPRGSRKKFGALVLGVYDHGKLVYIGHTGGGFDEGLLNQISAKLMPLTQKQSPFETTPKTNAPVTWVKPKLVCEVGFSEWTSDGHMRQPIFLGLRPDKKPIAVHREIPK